MTRQQASTLRQRSATHHPAHSGSSPKAMQSGEKGDRPESEIDGLALCQTSGQPSACMYVGPDEMARTRRDCPALGIADLRARRGGRARCLAWWRSWWAGVSPGGPEGLPSKSVGRRDLMVRSQARKASSLLERKRVDPASTRFFLTTAEDDGALPEGGRSMDDKTVT